MDILIDARMYGLEHSGIGRYIVNLVEALKNLKNEKYSFTIILRKGYFDKLILPGSWRKIQADFRHYSFQEQLFLPRLIEREKPDLVHFPHLNIPFFWQGRFIVTIHDLTMQRQGINATSLPAPIYYSKRVPFLLITRKAVKDSVKIIAPSHAVKNDLINYYSIDPDKVEVIYEGVDHLTKGQTSKLSFGKLCDKYKLKKPYFLYIGNAYPHKNLETAIRAIKLLNEKRKSNINLVIGGKRDIFWERIKEKVREFNASKFVFLVGEIGEKDLYLFYKNSVAFLYPSFSEGFGLPGLEAMAAGTLVLASDIPVFREVYEKSAFYFDPRDVESILESMRFVLILEAEKRRKIIKKAQRFVKKYSWRKTAEETFKVYRVALQL